MCADDSAALEDGSEAAAPTPAQTPAVRKLSSAALSAFTSRGGLGNTTPAPIQTPRRSVLAAHNAGFFNTLNGMLSVKRQKITEASDDPVCRTLFPGGAQASSKGMIYSFECFQITFSGLVSMTFSFQLIISSSSLPVL